MKINNISFREDNVSISYAFNAESNSFYGEQVVGVEDYTETKGLDEVKSLVSGKIGEEINVLNFRVNNIRSNFSSPSDFEPTSYDVSFTTPQAANGNSLNGSVRLTAEEFEEAGSLSDKVKAKIADLVTETAE